MNIHDSTDWVKKAQHTCEGFVLEESPQHRLRIGWNSETVSTAYSLLPTYRKPQGLLHGPIQFSTTIHTYFSYFVMQQPALRTDRPVDRQPQILDVHKNAFHLFQTSAGLRAEPFEPGTAFRTSHPTHLWLKNTGTEWAFDISFPHRPGSHCLSTGKLGVETLFLEFTLNRLSVITLNNNHTVFDGTTRTAFTFQILGNLFQVISGFLKTGYGCDCLPLRPFFSLPIRIMPSVCSLL